MSMPCTRISGRLASLLLVLLAFGSSPALAETTLKTLLMPGKLVQGHAKLEGDCNQCHVSFAKEAQDKLCIECHDAVAADIRSATGFHGRLGSNAGQQVACRQCHTDHIGRDGDIVGLDRDTFRHDRTDFALEGRHVSLECAACHAEGKRFRDAPSECVACHLSDDRHDGVLGKQCESCHDVAGWQQTRFDHATTKFALQGAHQQVSCASCHPAQRYAGTPQQCVDCHAINDVHHGSRGSDCQQCHQQSDWKSSRFDHLHATGFALRGRHAQARCDSCHRQGKFEVKLGNTCIDCHRGEDIHKARNGSDCGRCHGESSWRQSRFDHGRDTKFALRGGHEKLACDSCHRSRIGEKPLSGECNTCHAPQDPHQGQLGRQCQQCHSEKGWQDKVRFDHALTAFPLLGLHATLPCESCHLGGRYKDAEMQCNSCHGADDPHRGNLGTRCDGCHNPGGWSYWQFDHDKATDFPLTGAHRELACGNCHTRPLDTIKKSGECFGCHAGDDEHGGQFGRDCGQCHGTDAFDRVRMDN